MKEITLQEKLSKIREVCADKTISMWLRIRRVIESDGTTDEGVFINFYVPDEYHMYMRVLMFNGNILKFEDLDYETIGHPPHIGTVLDWIEKHRTPVDLKFTPPWVWFDEDNEPADEDKIWMIRNMRAKAITNERYNAGISKPLPLPHQPIPEEWNNLILSFYELVKWQETP